MPLFFKKIKENPDIQHLWTKTFLLDVPEPQQG